MDRTIVFPHNGGNDDISPTVFDKDLLLRLRLLPNLQLPSAIMMDGQPLNLMLKAVGMTHLQVTNFFIKFLFDYYINKYMPRSAVHDNLDFS